MNTNRKLGLFILVAALAGALGTGCNSSSTPSAPADCTNCSAITPENFVSALVSLAQSGQIASGYANSKLAKDSSLQPGYFVIWDGETQTYMAVDVDTQATYDVGGCTGGAGCSGSNPQSAALGFVNATVETHLGASGGVTVANGTDLSGYFGTAPGANDDVAGTITGIPLLETNQVDSAGNPIFNDTYGDNTLYNVAAQTKDVDLQRAQLQSTSLLQRAAQISSGLQMDFKSAVQLTQLADRIQVLQSAQKQLTDADRDAISQNLMSIAGISEDELNQAIMGGMKGDTTQASALIDKVSQHLGMPTTTLRDEILPKLGVSLN